MGVKLSLLIQDKNICVWESNENVFRLKDEVHLCGHFCLLRKKELRDLYNSRSTTTMTCRKLSWDIHAAPMKKTGNAYEISDKEAYWENV
jgi:hypothetical protein